MFTNFYSCIRIVVKLCIFSLILIDGLFSYFFKTSKLNLENKKKHRADTFLIYLSTLTKIDFYKENLTLILHY